jgi:hypothetical protein
MESLGDTFRQRRLDKQKEEDDMRREMIQKQMADAAELRQQRGLDIENKRLETETARANTESEGKVDVHLKASNGGSFHYTGPKSGYQKFVDETAKQGVTLTPTDEPLPKSQMGTYKFDTDNGSVEIPVESIEQLDAITAKVKAMGGKAPPKTAPLPAAGIQYENQAKSLEDQATQMESQNPDAAKALRGAAQRLRQQNIKNPPNLGYQTTQITPLVDPMGKLTGENRTNITQRVPLGTTATAPVGGKVKMLHPDGKTIGFVPSEQVEAAKAQGYQLAPQ